MNSALERSLFILSSVEFQNENIILGNSDSYVMIDELIDDSVYLIGRELLSRRYASDLRGKLEDLMLLLKDRGAEIDDMNNYDIINKSLFWREVGELSGDILCSIEKNKI